MMDFLIRFAQAHESFRKPEIQALATLVGVNVEFLVYTDESPFCVVRLPDEAAARKLIARSILAKDIYELWGQGKTYPELHDDVRRRTEAKWEDYMTISFRFNVDTFCWKRSSREKTALIQSFGFLGFEGPIKMVDPDEEFGIFEEYDPALSEAKTRQALTENPEPRQLYFGRWLSRSSRDMIDKYDLKKRNYISTTSMDAELSFVTANMALADEGKVFYDPFVGTGGFCVSAAYFGAHTLGSDIDGRSFRGNEKGKRQTIGLVRNLRQYGLESSFLDAFSSDLTNTPFRSVPLFDGIICDPPYGVREGLKVLGSRDGQKKEVVLIEGVPTYRMEGYIAPKRQYSFEALLDDILDFASRTLVTDGRMSFWMPTANEDEVELETPSHPCLELVSVCIQRFNSWSRRLLTYRRLPNDEVSTTELVRQKKEIPVGKSADELNSFRKRYFGKSRAAESEPNGDKPG